MILKTCGVYIAYLFIEAVELHSPLMQKKVGGIDNPWMTDEMRGFMLAKETKLQILHQILVPSVAWLQNFAERLIRATTQPC